MKKFFRLITCITAILFTICATEIKAQDDLLLFLSSGLEDANAVIHSSAGPILETIGNNFSNGWYNTAEPLNKWHFDFRLIATASFAPVSKQSFNLGGMNLHHIRPAPGAPDKIPTLFGEENSAAQFEIYASDADGNTYSYAATYDVPVLGIKFFPALTPQLSFGLPKNTEIMIRYLPSYAFSTQSISDFTLQTWGIGVKHDIKQWIPGIQHLPFHLSLLASYTRADVTFKGPLFTPEDIYDNTSQDIISNPSPGNYTLQKLTFESSSWQIRAIISKKLPIITPFGAIGLTGYTSRLGADGPYPVVSLNASEELYMTEIVDPINVKVNNVQFGFTGGVRVKLSIVSLTIAGTYAPGNYSSATFALGLGWFN